MPSPLLSTLKKRSQFIRLRHSKTVFKSPYFIIQFDKSDNDLCQIGYTASKKIGKAPARNFVKRRLRHLVHLFLQPIVEKNDNLEPFHMVFIARSKLKEAPFDDVKRAFEKGLKYCLGNKE